LGDRDQAISLAQKVEGLNPSAENVFDIGRIYHMLGEFRTALSTYLQADSLGYGKKGRLYASIAACYQELGETDQAQRFAESAVECDPGDDYVKTISQAIGSRRDEKQPLGN
jgi:tetratricopeptide (TPR) repeat protein